MSSSSLCPGYKHVEEFGADSEYEDGDDAIEEFYVTLDLDSAEPTLIPSSSTYRLIGLDTPTPFMQLSGTVLKGRHESLLGTELFFTEAKDTQDLTKRHLSFVSSTERRIRFKEVSLRPKAPSTTDAFMPEVGQGREDKGRRSGVESQPEESIGGPSVNRMTGKKEDIPRKRRKSKKRSEKEHSSTVSKRKKSTTTKKGKGKGKGKDIDVAEGEVSEGEQAGAGPESERVTNEGKGKPAHSESAEAQQGWHEDGEGDDDLYEDAVNLDEQFQDEMDVDPDPKAKSQHNSQHQDTDNHELKVGADMHSMDESKYERVQEP